MPDQRAWESLPPEELWPKRDFAAAGLHYPEKLNAAEELVRRNVESGFSRKPAIYYEQQAISYGEVERTVRRLAGALAARGLGKGDRVLLRLPNSPEFIYSWLAVVHLGAIAVATVPLLRAREMEKIICDAGIGTAIVNSRFLADIVRMRGKIPELQNIILVGEPRSGYLHVQELIAHSTSEIDAETTRRDDIALLAYTSGSTGEPKGTIHFHEDILAMADGVARDNLNISSADICAGHPTLAFTFGLGGLFVFPFRFGAATVLTERFTPQGMLQTLKDYQATLSFCAPS